MDNINGFSDFAEIVVDTRTIEGMHEALQIDTALTIAKLRAEAEEWRKNGYPTEGAQMDVLTDELERLVLSVFTSPADTV